MNNEKYNIIKKEILNNLENYNLQEQTSTLIALKELREKLRDDLVNNPKDSDRAGILLAFYECTLNNPNFNILNNFCKEKFIEYFNTRELLERKFSDIAANDTLYDAFIKLGSNDDILMLYNYTKETNDIFLSNNDKTYDSFFNKINDLCVMKGLVESATILKTRDVVVDEAAAKSAVLFQEAAANIGVDAPTLVKEVKKEEIPLRVDEIRISSYVANLLTNKNAIISTIPFKRLRTFLKRINQKRVFKNLDFEIINIDDLNILRISGDEVALDKIASCDNNIFKKIVNSVKRKKKIEESIDVIDENTIISSIRKADANAQLDDEEKINDLSKGAANLVSSNNFITLPEDYLKSINQNESNKEDLSKRYEPYDSNIGNSIFVTPTLEEYSKLNGNTVAIGGTKVADINLSNSKKM